MKKLIFSLLTCALLLSACLPPAGGATTPALKTAEAGQTNQPDAIETATLTPYPSLTSTQTATATETPTKEPTVTSTPEKLTLEKLFKDLPANYSLDTIKEMADVVTGPNEFRNLHLPVGSLIIVVNGNEITYGSNVDAAGIQMDSGATALVVKAQPKYKGKSLPHGQGEAWNMINTCFLEAALLQYQKGNTGILITYGDYDTARGKKVSSITLQMGELEAYRFIFKQPNYFAIMDKNYNWALPSKLVDTSSTWDNQVSQMELADANFIVIFPNKGSLPYIP